MTNAPAETTAAEAPATLADRYGTRRSGRIDRRLGWIIALAAVVLGLAVVLFGGWQNSSQVSVHNIGFDIVDDQHATTRFEVTGPADVPIACSVEALSSAKATVGWRIIEIPVSGSRTNAVSADLVTTAPAVAANAVECWVVTAD